MPEKLLTPEEVAQYLNVPLRTVYAWRYAGSGPQGFRVGRHVRWRRSTVERWIDEQAQAESGRATA